MDKPDAEEALQRLVLAMVGTHDAAATSLARRVLGPLGGTSNSTEDAAHVDLSSMWRRMARKAPDTQCQPDVASLYGRLEQACQTPSQHTNPSLPPKALTVLTKLMGKHMVLPEPSVDSIPPPPPPPPIPNTTASASASTPSHASLEASPSSRSVLSPARTSHHHQVRNPQQTSAPKPNTTTAALALATASRTTTKATTKSQARTAFQPRTAPLSSQDRILQERQIEEEKKELESEEALLLRECLYSLQGIDGERIRYYHKEDEEYGSTKSRRRLAGGDPLTTYDGIRIRSPALSHSLLYTGRVLETRLGSGAMDALRISAEAGWLYHRIQLYTHQVQQDESKGVVARAFCGTLGDESREYYSLLTQYESQLANLTLRQLLVDLRLPTTRLQTLALVTDGVRHLSGGHLLTALFQHALHGDTRHAKLVQSMLSAAARPWFDILYTWTTQGVLSDPHQEFFVTERPNVDDRHLWKEKYTLNKDQIPVGILPKELVGPAFNVGKGINFIRRCLLDGKWTMHLESSGDGDEENDDDGTTNNGLNRDLGYRYTPYATDGNISLQRTLSRAAHLVHTHILRTLRDDNHMMQHLYALKQFLFLGQGDFFSALMDGLHSEFRLQPPGVAGIYKHSLLAIVEGALRSTNAKYMPSYVLDRLQVELLMDPDDEAVGLFGPDQLSGNNDQRTVWDIFMLDYQVPDPLVAIVHPGVLDKYKMVFSLLFCLKRVEFMLNFTWRQSATLQHALQAYGQYNGIQISTSEAYAQAAHLLRKISILRQSMMHLIVNLKSYFMFEVLEGGWRRLQSDIDSATTLDEVIYAHDRYINGIVRKSLLQTEDMNHDVAQQKLADQVQTLLQVSGDFCDLQERLFHDSLFAAESASQKRMEADRRANQGQWGFDSELDIVEEENIFGLADDDTLKQVTRIEQIYNQNALELLQVLGDKVNANPDDNDDQNSVVDREALADYGVAPRQSMMIGPEDELDSQRFLIAQLDHNDYYGKQGLRR